MNWKMLAARDAIKALVPFQAHLRRAKRRLVPYTPNTENLSLTLQQGLEQIELIRSAGGRCTGTVVEIGAGWMPIIPLLYKLAGAQKQVLLDLERLMDDSTVQIAKNYLVENKATISSALGISATDFEQVLSEEFAPDYRVPGLVGNLAIQSVDLIVSRAVLEHVKPAELDQMFSDIVAVLKPDGLVCVTIDNSDHWEHRDKTISRVNFLKYQDDWLWQLASLNRQNYQNRYRHSDYIAIFKRFNFEILAEKRVVDPQALAALAGIKLADPFRHLPPDDLATMTSVIIMRLRPAGSARSTPG